MFSRLRFVRCVVFSTLALFLFASAGRLLAEEAKSSPETKKQIVLERSSAPTASGTEKPSGNQFDIRSLFMRNEICASGSCNCSTCVCYGTSECCDIGCDACWNFLDTRGGCSAS